jgi:hypothetical protein
VLASSPIHSFDDLLAAMQKNPKNPQQMTEMMEAEKAGATLACPQAFDTSCSWWQYASFSLLALPHI